MYFGIFFIIKKLYYNNTIAYIFSFIKNMKDVWILFLIIEFIVFIINNIFFVKTLLNNLEVG